MEMDLERPTSLILRTSYRDGRSHGGFQWPRSGYVEPDGFDEWDPHNPPWHIPEDTAHFSRGLYGWLNGDGDRSYGSQYSGSSVWMVVETYTDQIFKCIGKVKFPYAWVVGWYNSEHEAMQVIRSGKGLQHQLREQKAAEDRAIADEKRRQEEEEQQAEEDRRHQIWLAQQSFQQGAQVSLEQEVATEKPAEASRMAQKPVYVAESIPLPSMRPEPRYEAPAQPRKHRAPEPAYQGMTEGDRIFLSVCSVVLVWTIKLLWAVAKMTMRAIGKVLLLALRKFVALAKPPAPRVVIIRQQDEVFLQILGQVRELGVTQVKQIAAGEDQPAYWVFEKEKQEAS